MGMVSNLPETRQALHAVAEQVISAALYRATGRIGLRPTPGGFGSPRFTVDGHERQLRVEGVDLVVLDGADERRSPLRTVAAAAAFAGIEPGAPDIYPAATPVDPDAPLPLNPAAAAVVHAWFAQSAEALATFCADVAADAGPPVPQLWPEHFDLAVTIAEVNYGASPGDDAHDLPYAYIGPWTPTVLPTPFRNEPFGASRPLDALPTPDAILTFFTEGHALVSR